MFYPAQSLKNLKTYLLTYQKVFLSFLKSPTVHVEFDTLRDAHGPGDRFKIHLGLVAYVVAKEFDFSMSKFYVDLKRAF